MLNTISLFFQTGLPGFDDNVDDEVSAPIDSQMGLLILAGVILGASFILWKRKQAKTKVNQ